MVEKFERGRPVDDSGCRNDVSDQNARSRGDDCHSEVSASTMKRLNSVCCYVLSDDELIGLRCCAALRTRNL